MIEILRRFTCDECGIHVIYDFRAGFPEFWLLDGEQDYCKRCAQQRV